MIKPNLGCIVGLPLSRTVMPEWAVSLATQNWPLNMNVAYIPLRGLSVDKARQLIAETAVSMKAPYLLFVDDDVELPMGGARQLIQTMKQSDDDVRVVAGIYPNRLVDPTEPVLYEQNGHGAFWRWRKNTIFDLPQGGCVGTGCMLIRTDVFEQLEKPWFLTTDSPTHKVTDDAYFCDKLQSAGFRIRIDAHVICTHWDNANQQPYRMPEDSYPMRFDGTVDLTRALNIPDLQHPTEDELRWLASQAARSKVIVEVGSYLGRSTVAMAANTSGVVYAVDDWHGPRDIEIPEKDRKELFDRFRDNIMGLKIVPLKTDHAQTDQLPLEWLRGKPEEKPDMVFIDGSHEYEDVKRDIMIWKSRIRPGGVLCGHDRDWPGVAQALNELLPEWSPVSGETVLWQAAV